MQTDGVIKFNCRLIESEPPGEAVIKELNQWREKLYRFGLIGQDKTGIGYGNISIRFNNEQFIITGSQTGGIEHLSPEHYTIVTKADIGNNYIECKGNINASSESLTHAVIYIQQPRAGAVVHIHSLDLWTKLLHKIPTTKKGIEYGTPEMAEEIARLLKSAEPGQGKIFAMASHAGGLVAYGGTLEEACNIFPGIEA